MGVDVKDCDLFQIKDVVVAKVLKSLVLVVVMLVLMDLPEMEAIIASVVKDVEKAHNRVVHLVLQVLGDFGVDDCY